MEKKTRLPKPLVECEVPISLHQERADRLRGGAASSQEEEARVLSMKDWARHCYTRYIEWQLMFSPMFKHYFEEIKNILIQH